MTRCFRAAKSLSAVMAMVMAACMLVTLQGCSDDEKEQKKPDAIQKAKPVEEVVEQVSVDDIRAGHSSDFDCDDPTGMTADKRFWCRAEKAWRESESYQVDNSDARDEFIQAWKLGSLDAMQARTPAIDNLQNHPIAAAGYETGYISVLDSQGVLEYDCSDGDESDNEYRDRWCEASAAYNSSRQGEASNAVLRNSYINGYMSGRAIALTLPTSMESLFGGEAPKEGAKSAIDTPEGDAPKSILVFHRGFTDGFQAMIDTVRESVNQVMEQMQNMPGMDGMPPPGMEGGMPPGMEHMMPPMPEGDAGE